MIRAEHSVAVEVHDMDRWIAAEPPIQRLERRGPEELDVDEIRVDLGLELIDERPCDDPLVDERSVLRACGDEEDAQGRFYRGDRDRIVVEREGSRNRHRRA